MPTLVLFALSGPLKGSSLELAEDGPWVLGRQTGSDFLLPDPAVSRAHCRLWKTPEGWQLADLESRGGTFVNGRPVRQATVQPGDLIALGGSVLLVQAGAAGPGAKEAATPLPELAVETEVVRAIEGSVHLPAGRAAESSLQALLGLAAKIQAQPDAAALGRELLAQTLAALPAERAALLPVAGAELPPLYRHARGEESAPFPVSRTVVGRTASGRATLLWRGEPEAVPAASVSPGAVGSLASAPLAGPDQVLAVLYLETGPAAPPLGDDHLEILAAIAILASGALAGAVQRERLEREAQRLREAALGSGMIGESPALRRVAEMLARVAATPSTVLILGESGTGKELAARTLHQASPRAGSPFVAINCATLSETLLESELFGHERGAFTGAVAQKAGKLELAHGGTLFLDEVGELPLSTQAKLLRVLQERTFERVGGTRPIEVDLRLVAATNRDLKRSVEEGSFRTDLYYRLAVIEVRMPALRERREDVLLLAHNFAALHGQRIRGRAVGIAAAARALLLGYDWPGNVRELANAIERAVVLGLDDTLRPEDLPESLLDGAPGFGVPLGRYHEALQGLKRRLILDAVATSDGVISQAAEKLGLHPNHLHRVITNLGLRGEVEALLA